MKIGIITFHWATNYGAVLQAYALQQYLEMNSYDCEIINYIPIKAKIVNLLRQILKANNRVKWQIIKKEIYINSFRRSYLRLSKAKYYSNKALKKYCKTYDIFISGSDQIWNEYFTLNGELKPTLSYYLDFVQNDKSKISYAVSFGTNELTENMEKLIKPFLMQFNYLSVREKTGKQILSSLGFESELAVDPTLLINREIYDRLANKAKIKNKYDLFSYILHDKQENMILINNKIKKGLFKSNHVKEYQNDPVSVNDWLYSLRESKFVITNSYHGTIFAIIFHKPFIAMLIKGKRMNDRLITLLSLLGLENRLISNEGVQNIETILKDKIKWDQVESKINQIRNNSIRYLLTALKGL